MVQADSFLEEFFIDLQEALGRLLKDFYRGIDVEKIQVVVAVDAAYKDDLMSVVAVKWNLNDGFVSSSSLICKAPYRYVPGLLFLREGPPMLHIIKQLGDDWQLLLVDAHGLLHPRRMGLAVFLGLLLGKPSIGVAKSLMVGSEMCGDMFGEVEVDGAVFGYWFRLDKSKKFYVSPGYLVSVQQIPDVIRRLGSTYPEALRLADVLSREILKDL